ncbi:carbohydrate porin [Polystyrenella longa]|nr:carbohydrate porin [Polystyrenella longa]
MPQSAEAQESDFSDPEIRPITWSTETCDSCQAAAMPCPCESCGCSQGCDDHSLPTLNELLSLPEHGIVMENNVTQFYMGVVEGGQEHEFRYSGHGDYLINADFSKMGGPEGLFLKLRAEHRFGQSMSGTTGALLPSNVAADLPVADSEEVYLTNVLFTQMFSENFGVFAGKTDTLDGDMNAFAHGRGIKQFSNMAFVATPIALRSIPYSSLATGFVWLEQGEPIFTFTVMNPTDTTRTSGFDELFEEGVALIPELRLPTNFFGMPGHQLFGATWSSRTYTALDQDPRIILPNVPVAKSSDTWSLYYNFDQYLYVDPCDSKKGWGVFGRAGIAEADTNPLEWFLSFGIGGNSVIHGRDEDTFGVGYYYAGTSDEIAPFVQNAIGGINDGQGVEMYYNIAVNRSLTITPDAQVIIPARDQIDTAVLLGVRANLTF